MESQITLVDAPSSHFTITFEKNSMKNNTVWINSRPVYTISTSDASDTRTTIFNNLIQRTLVTVQRRSLLADALTFDDRYDGKKVKIDSWLRAIKLPDGNPGHVIRTTQGNYIWKVDIVHRHVLYAEEDLDTPLAYMVIATATSPMSLIIAREVEDIVDDILVSFMILELRMRLREKW
ncbi:hypothetical protein BDQ12DRAFT_688278 [Crucibulum laeve]|uniref:DUF6593 domain-containing protein n=1 Tax=Crucibulum laeve TaxID=68775 RepID=A0A5C3LSF5_9AGAR|nr:hypothetical protein BDQ12DRAFT_688278 [Crucibulum laeve]